MPQENKINISSVKVSKNRIDFDYEISGEWSRYFNTDEKLFLEFSTDVSNVPESIAIIPLLGNILPIAWLCDAEIEVPTIDKSFLDSIPLFKKGYVEMHPMLTFKGSLIATEVETNQNCGNNGSLALFSGGVDAFNTLVCHIEENPTLVTLWGSDVKLDDFEGWKVVNDHVQSVCKEFDLKAITIKSNFRSFINEARLEELVQGSGDGWWHGYQHGLGIITHTAPIAYVLGNNTVYIASSFTIAQKGISCASDPSIDNFIRFGGTSVVHDGYEFDRLMKIRNITKFVERTGHKIRVHVCWQSRGGENCCRCEKCLRTIMGLYATGSDPRDYGFNFSEFSEISKFLKENRWMMNANIISRWGPIQRELRANYQLKDVEPNLRWLYKTDLSKFRPYPLSFRIKNRLKRLLSRIRQIN